MPDSVDIICLMNPDNLHPTLAGEFAKVREKGTRVIYNIDYNAIEKLWEKVLADEEANKPEEPAAPDTPEATQDEGGEGGGEGEPTPEEELELRFLEFCRPADRQSAEPVCQIWLRRCPGELYRPCPAGYAGRGKSAVCRTPGGVLLEREDLERGQLRQSAGLPGQSAEPHRTSPSWAKAIISCIPR